MMVVVARDLLRLHVLLQLREGLLRRARLPELQCVGEALDVVVDGLFDWLDDCWPLWF